MAKQRIIFLRMTAIKPTIVLFDMDNTTIRHVNPRLIGCIEFLDNALYAVTNIFRRKREIVDFSEEPAKRKRLLVHHALHKFRRKEIEQIVEPCPGIYALLTLLKKNNVRLGIVSNGLGKGYGHDVLEKFNLEHFFEIDIFREDVQKSKPHPDPILRAVRAMDGEELCEEDGGVIWYIGDRHKDIKATLAADKILSCKILPFSYGLNAAMAVLQNNVGADHIILNYFDFIARIKPLIEGSSTVETAGQRKASSSAS